MKRIAALALVLAAVFAASAHADSTRTIYAECFDVGGAEWFVLVDAVEAEDPTACSPLLAEGPLPPPPVSEPEGPSPLPDTGGVDVGLGADPNIAPDPALYSTEVRCPDGSIWAVAIDDPFVCPASP